jgi:GntR family transcriptional regulator / MocR family aminotransferase
VGDQRGPVLLIELQRRGGPPLHAQLERRLRDDVRSGRLAPGAALPSSRALAAALGVSRGVVTEAYGQLAAEGFLVTRQGAPVRVASGVQRGAPRAPAPPLLPRFAYDLRPGAPDLAGFPRAAWLRSLRAGLRRAPLDALDPADPRGAAEVREALADHLVRVRHAAAEPEHLLVCGGLRHGLSLVLRWLRARGVEVVAVEEPGRHEHRLIAEQAGLRVAPVPVDEAGLRVDRLDAVDAGAVVVTPAHQVPTGVALSAERRAALLEWAEARERLVVEDDPDGELRHDGGGPGALQGLGPERVVHIGSAAARLAPGLALGWMLTPSWLTPSLTAVLEAEGSGRDVVGQLALADLLERGELDRHVRRARARLRRRRAALLAALTQRLPGVTVPDQVAAGAFLLARLPDGADEAALVAAAAARGVGVEGLELFRYDPGGPPGLVLGFGGLAEPALERAVALLADAAATARASRGLA